MKETVRWFLYAVLSIVVVVVTGCGGGSESSSSSETPIITPATTADSTLSSSNSPATTTGSTLYDSKCAGCHGASASSNLKSRITVALTQSAITSNIGGMGTLSGLSNSDIQAVYDYLTPSTIPATTPAVPASPVLDGITLYSNNCASCHGSLASSAKAGASASRIQSAINSNIGNMGYLSTLSAPQISAIETALTTVTPSPVTVTACGSCHSIPPATGKHAKHLSKGIACASCHGAGYSNSSVDTATHNNGIKNIATSTGWTSANRTCANSCHGRETW